MDWIGSRIAQRCERWLDMLETESKEGGKMWRTRTPWWDEVKRCVDGDHVPSSAEGWNHPVSRAYPLWSVTNAVRADFLLHSYIIVILAVSTTAANPLQALQDLASRAFDFPPWVDITSLRYFLIIHPSNSPLADPMYVLMCNYLSRKADVDVKHDVILHPELKHCSMPSRSSMACTVSFYLYNSPRLHFPTPFPFPLSHHDYRHSPPLTLHLYSRRSSLLLPTRMDCARQA